MLFSCAIGFVGWLWGQGWILNLTSWWCPLGSVIQDVWLFFWLLWAPIPLCFCLFVTVLLTDTCRCRGQLHLFLFPSNTGSPLIVRDLGGLYGPLFHTFCVSVSSYLTWPTTERHFLSAGCSLSVPGGECLFSINLTLFLTGSGILACATHQGMYPPHTVSLRGSLPQEAECWPLPVTKLSAEG